MKLLAIDTSTGVAGVALMEDEKLVCEYNLQAGLTHSQRLMPLIDHAFAMVDWKKTDIDALGVVVGPGSFTGIRIGIATVKGIADALGLPVASVNTLEALAYMLPYAREVITPLLDARRGQVYAAAYRWEAGELREILPPCAMEIDAFFARTELSGQACIALGDGALANHAYLDAQAGIMMPPVPLRMQRAGAVAALAGQRIAQGQGMEAGELAALYLRKSQAEQLREDGKLHV